MVIVFSPSMVADQMRRGLVRGPRLILLDCVFSCWVWLTDSVQPAHRRPRSRVAEHLKLVIPGLTKGDVEKPA